MAERCFAALALVLCAGIVHAQEPEFAATAPAKVPLPIAGLESPAPDTPPAATAEESSVSSGVVEPEDPDMAQVGAIMAEQEAAERSPTSATGETPASEPEMAASPIRELGRAMKKVVPVLCGILIVILLALAAAKRWGRNTPMLAGHQLARVIGRVGLSPQASIHFVQTNGEVLVIGVTQQSVSLLRTFEAKDFDVPAAAPVKTTSKDQTTSESSKASATSFLAQMKETRATMGVEAAADEDLDQLKGELQRLKQYFQDSTRGRD